MTKKHFHVFVGFDGCLPDSQSACATLGEARSYAMWWRDGFREDGCVVKGNLRRDGRYDIFRGGEYWQHVDIESCDEEDCYNEGGELYDE